MSALAMYALVPLFLCKVNEKTYNNVITGLEFMDILLILPIIQAFDIRTDYEQFPNPLPVIS
jgi:hypothetical protein